MNITVICRFNQFFFCVFGLATQLKSRIYIYAQTYDVYRMYIAMALCIEVVYLTRKTITCHYVNIFIIVLMKHQRKTHPKAARSLVYSIVLDNLFLQFNCVLKAHLNVFYIYKMNFDTLHV